MNQKSRVLIGLASVCDFLGVTRPTIYQYLKLGMPGAKLAGTWHFHIDHIEEFFRRKTMRIDVVNPDDLKDEETAFTEHVK